MKRTIFNFKRTTWKTLKLTPIRNYTNREYISIIREKSKKKKINKTIVTTTMMMMMMIMITTKFNNNRALAEEEEEYIDEYEVEKLVKRIKRGMTQTVPPKHYITRKKIDTKLQNTIMEKEQEGIIYVCGEEGVGKTTSITHTIGTQNTMSIKTTRQIQKHTAFYKRVIEELKKETGKKIIIHFQTGIKTRKEEIEMFIKITEEWKKENLIKNRVIEMETATYIEANIEAPHDKTIYIPNFTLNQLARYCEAYDIGYDDERVRDFIAYLYTANPKELDTFKSINSKKIKNIIQKSLETNLAEMIMFVKRNKTIIRDLLDKKKKVKFERKWLRNPYLKYNMEKDTMEFKNKRYEKVAEQLYKEYVDRK